jgi:proteasome lid subunit RPN8/RPN11
MKLTKKVLADAGAHACAEFPRESCGLVVRVGSRQEYRPCRNIAPTPSAHFVIHPLDHDAAERRGKLVAVVHSHPGYPARPSEGDRAACEATQLYWWVLRVDKANGEPPVVTETQSFGPTGWQAPLIGRSFHYGTLDCWGLARDWYARDMGLTMPNFDRGVDGWWNDTDPKNTFSPYENEAYMEAAGLYRVPGPPQRGDLIVMQIQSKSEKPNHVGVLIDDHGTMLHHLYNALSERIPYGGYWYENTRFILRPKTT